MGIAAAIDIGSNSVRLLVAQTDGFCIKPLYKDLYTTRLGTGVDASGMLSPQNVQTTLRAIREFRAKAFSMGAERIEAVATSAVRDAINGDCFIERVRELGLKSRVLNGTQEAEAGYIGAILGCGYKQKEIFMVDIGGGSTELVSGAGFRIKGRKSLDIGAVRMTEKFIRNDPAKMAEIEAARRYAADKIYKNTKDMIVGDAEMVGIGGTITSLAAVVQGVEEYDADRIHRYVLNRRDVCEMLERLSAMDTRLRRKIPGLQPKRADIIVAGTIILKSLMEYWNFDRLIVSEWDNLEGVLYQNLIEVDKDTDKNTL